MRLRLLVFCLPLVGATVAEAEFRVQPYLQNPTATSMTVVWFSAEDAAGTLTLFAGPATTPIAEKISRPEAATALAYPGCNENRSAEYPRKSR